MAEKFTYQPTETVVLSRYSNGNVGWTVTAESIERSIELWAQVEAWAEGRGDLKVHVREEPHRRHK